MAVRFSLLLGALALALAACTDGVHEFEGVEGPDVDTPLLEPSALGPEQYDTGGTSRLAVLLTEDESNWLALASGLKTIGVPFRMTRNVEAALTHDVVMAYPQITGRNLSPDELDALRRHVADGGTLIATNVLGGGLGDLFGFDGVVESKARHEVRFAGDHPETAGFADLGLDRVRVGNPLDAAANPGTNSYTGLHSPPLATYDNGEAAVIAHDFGEGRAFALGVDLGQLLSKGYNRRQVGISEHYANAFQPSLDAWLVLVEEIYRGHDAPVVTLGTVPDGRRLSVMMTYDIDFSRSLANAVPYARDLADRGVESTHFIQTKYVRDYNDEIFFDDTARGLLGELQGLGAEIASHSVAHSNAMWELPTGDGTERYPGYTPRVRTADRVSGATLMGEARVSKFLLEEFSDGTEVVSFRPGYLANPDRMPPVLQSSGYRYSSSVTANVSLTHLPFRLAHGRGVSAASSVFEFPITVEDELGPPVMERVDAAVETARRIAQLGGIYLVLLHTDAVDERLEFQRAIVDEVEDYAWMGTVAQFGDWWSARDAVSVDVVELDDGRFEVRLDAPRPIDGLSLELDEAANLVVSTLPGVSMRARSALLPGLQGSHTLTFAPRALPPTFTTTPP